MYDKFIRKISTNIFCASYKENAGTANGEHEEMFLNMQDSKGKQNSLKRFNL